MNSSQIKYSYIHSNKKNYLGYKGNFPIPSDLNNKIKKAYTDMTNRAKKNFDEIQKQTENGLTIKQLEEALTADDFVTNAENGVISQGNKVVEDLKKGISLMYQTGAVLKDESDNEKQVAQLSNFLEQMKIIVNEINNISDDLLKYYKNAGKNENKKNAIKNLFGNGNNFKILNINKTALTSLESAGKKIKLLEGAAKGYGGGNPSIKYKNAKGEDVNKTVKEVVFSFSKLLTNILGGYGEAMIALKALETVDKLTDDFVKKTKENNMQITVTGEGTKTLSGSGKVSKSDIAINYNIEGVNIKVGISAKAQKKDGSSSETTFQTSKLKVFLANIARNIQYQYLNNLYHGIYNTNEQILMNRYIAAMNFDNAVTGVKIGDNVMFLAFLDKVITVKDFYESISKINNISQLPSIRVSGATKVKSEQFEGPDISEYDKGRRSSAGLAGARARRNLLLDLEAQIGHKF